MKIEKQHSLTLQFLDSHTVVILCMWRKYAFYMLITHNAKLKRSILESHYWRNRVQRENGLTKDLKSRKKNKLNKYYEEVIAF